MPSIKTDLAAELRQVLGLERAVETGTYLGDGARRLAASFPSVVTIELSRELHARASEALADTPRITALQGHSVEHLRRLAAEPPRTLYFLDGHWSGGATAGVEDECPVLREVEAIASGDDDPALIIDDARFFAAAPPPPHDASQWPTLMELFTAISARWPSHHITLLDDQVIAVPAAAKPAIDAYGRRLMEDAPAAASGLRDRLARVLGR